MKNPSWDLLKVFEKLGVEDTEENRARFLELGKDAVMGTIQEEFLRSLVLAQYVLFENKYHGLKYDSTGAVLEWGSFPFGLASKTQDEIRQRTIDLVEEAVAANDPFVLYTLGIEKERVIESDPYLEAKAATKRARKGAKRLEERALDAARAVALINRSGPSPTVLMHPNDARALGIDVDALDAGAESVPVPPLHVLRKNLRLKGKKDLS